MLYLLQGDFQQWNAVNLATAWHRLAKFLRERNAEKGRREQQDELDLQVRRPGVRCTFFQAAQSLGGS